MNIIDGASGLHIAQQALGQTAKTVQQSMVGGEKVKVLDQSSMLADAAEEMPSQAASKIGRKLAQRKQKEKAGKQDKGAQAK